MSSLEANIHVKANSTELMTVTMKAPFRWDLDSIVSVKSNKVLTAYIDMFAI